MKTEEAIQRERERKKEQKNTKHKHAGRIVPEPCGGQQLVHLLWGVVFDVDD